MKTPLFTASSIAELGSATLILDSERRHIAEANGAPDAQFIVRACNSHAQLVESLQAIISQADAQFRAGDRHATFNRQTIDAIRAALTAAQKVSP